MKQNNFFRRIFCAFTIFSTVVSSFSAEKLTLDRTVDSLGFPPPISINISGLPVETEGILKFDLLFMGFTNVPPDQAKYLINGSVSGGVTSGRVVEKINKNEVLAKGFSGGSQRTQIHALADFIAEKLTGKPGIAQSKIAFKVQPHTQGNGEIYIADYDGHNAQPVTQDNAIAAAPCWAGRAMLFYISYKNGKPDIFSHNLTNGARKAVAHFNGSNISPAVSPDGKKLAMILSKSGSPDLYVSDLDGGNLKQLTHTREEESSPCWSPDNRTICFSSRKTGASALYKISIDGGEMQRIPTPGYSPTEPDWSSDGKFIIFTSMAGDFSLFLIPADGHGGVTALVAGEDPSWAPNSRAVVFTRRSRNTRVLSLLDVPTKQVKDVGRISGSNSQPSWAK